MLKLKNVRTVVMDEADEMLDYGFLGDMKEILSAVPEQRQTMLFSATMNKEITAIAGQFQKDPVRVKIGDRTARSKRSRSPICRPNGNQMRYAG